MDTVVENSWFMGLNPEAALLCGAMSHAKRRGCAADFGEKSLNAPDATARDAA